MKRFLLPIVGSVILVLITSAQVSTNAPSAAVTSSASNEVTIESESLRGVFTNKELVAVYTGNVRVNHPRWWFRAGDMTTRFLEVGQRLEGLVLESNVFIVSLDERGRTNTARGDKAVYEHKIVSGVTNETIVLTGRPAIVDTPDMIMESDRIDGDMRTGAFDGGSNPRITIKGAAIGGSTNNPIFNPLKRP